jgi:hypothetical protein
MRKYAILVALLLVGACKSTEGPEPLVTTTILVSSTPNQITIGETAQASAIVKDQNGNPLTGKTITWTSLNQGVATVTSAGLIRGVSAGNATIQGSVDGVTGTGTVTVIAPSAICISGPIAVDIIPGEAKVVSSADSKGCIKISVTGAASQYVVIAANLNAQPDALASYAIKSDEGETVPNNSLLTTPSRVVAQLSTLKPDQPGALQASFEAGLRRTERRELNFRAGKQAYQSRVANSGVRMSVSAQAIPAVGDKTTFKVPAKFDANGKSLGGSCTSFTTVTATAKYISTRGIIYLDDAAPPGGFSDTEFQEIATEFDNLIYPTDVDYFGTPLDQDANSRVIMLYTPLVNKLTEANSNGFVGGFFFLGDLFPSTGPPNQSCQQSNMAEIFYLLAPDPTGTINNNTRSTATVRQGTRGTIAHEFQHMINGSERFRSPVTQDAESTWLDEGLAHFAEDLNGRTLKHLNDTGNYTFSQLLPTINDVNDYNAFFFQNFARFRLYLANPGPNSPTSFLADTSLAVRGAAWALIHYTADQYAPGGDIKAYIKSLIPGPDTGVVNLRSHAGNVPFDTLVAGWMVANYADDLGISGLPAKYTYKTYDMRDNVRKSISSNPAQQIYPLQPTIIAGSGFAVSNLLARSGSGNYFSFSRGPAGPARTFRFLNNDLSTAAMFTGASFIILRTQ